MIQWRIVMIRSKAVSTAPSIASARAFGSRRAASPTATAMMITPMTLLSTSGPNRLWNVFQELRERIAAGLRKRAGSELAVLAGPDDVGDRQTDEDRDECIERQ